MQQPRVPTTAAVRIVGLFPPAFCFLQACYIPHFGFNYTNAEYPLVFVDEEMARWNVLNHTCRNLGPKGVSV